jgi:hypothetical protein
MHTEPLRLRSRLAFGLLCLPAFAFCAPRTIELVVAADAAPQLRFGAADLRHALEERSGLQVRAVAQPSQTGLRIILGRRGDRVLPATATHPPDPPESYTVSIPASDLVVVEGSDPAGAMYGAFDLAEQIRAARGENFLAEIKPVTKSPFLALRGVNMFLTVQDIDLAGGAFWSDSFWDGFLGMMARDRYNLLDIHGPCDAVSLEFPNGFSYFVSLPDFPDVGVGREQAAKNMARFRHVVQLAADRGIKVAYMNYFAAPTIGPWKTLRYGIDERWTLPPQKFLTGAPLEEYTRQAVRSFLRQVPELWMFGFRVGESGQPEDFYKKTYLAALEDAPASLNLYVRTWIADPRKVREIGASTRRHFYIEPKYNGEQLGLPYQAALGGREYSPSGSYEDYTNLPRNYSILWQIRAHGTHRVFYWGSPDFARRTVRSCKFGDGAGFSMESMNAYCPELDYLHNNPAVDHRFYTWIYEREWLWHLVWGRTAYDPDVSDQVFRNEFARRFGPRAGDSVYQAVVEASKIVPFVYAYHNVGLDHQDFAPEFETGDHAFGARTRLWQGTRLVPYGGNNDDFLRVRTMDRTALADPAGYVDHLLRHVPDARMTPQEAAQFLETAAGAALQAIAKAAGAEPQSPQEFDCIRRDVEALASLARYYRDRILSATHLEFYRQTHHHPELVAAYDLLKSAAENWDRLSAVADGHFGYVPDTIRMGVSRFRWRDEGRSLGVDLDQLDSMESEFRQPRARHRMTIGHVPPFKVQPGRAVPLLVTCTPSSDAGHAYVFYRNSQQAGFTKLALRPESRFERTWRGEIPAADVVPGYLEYYFEADVGLGNPYGGTLEDRPPYLVYVNDNAARPVLTHQFPPAGSRGSSVELSVEVRAQARLAFVRVCYKRMPAAHEWLKLDMRPAGANRYTAQVPLTPEGILYYFEAADDDGNTLRWPDFLKETPYLAINPWAP